jgi:hypothetical protein
VPSDAYRRQGRRALSGGAATAAAAPQGPGRRRVQPEVARDEILARRPGLALAAAPTAAQSSGLAAVAVS